MDLENYTPSARSQTERNTYSVKTLTGNAPKWQISTMSFVDSERLMLEILDTCSGHRQSFRGDGNILKSDYAVCNRLLCSVAQLCPICCDILDCGPLGSSVHEIPQATIPEWVAISSRKRCSRPTDRTHVSCIDRWILYHSRPRGSQVYVAGWTTPYICTHTHTDTNASI